MKQILLYIATFIVLACVVGGCPRTPARYVTALTDADSLAECGRADSARTLLSAIPADSLSQADKALLYLLTVKAHDKAFLTHTSADTIRMALDYFGSHGPKLRRAEARYYEARVLTELKDYAAALDAYDGALALLGGDTTRAAIHLKDLIFSQNAQLLTSLHLYSEAIPFYQEAISISISNGDYPGAVLDIMDCVFCMMQLDRIDSAEAILAETDSFLLRLPPSTCAEIDISRRDLLRARGQCSEAVSGIDTVLAAIEPRFRDFGYRVAADAFHSLGNRDSSTHYARLWIANHTELSSDNKAKAYRILLHDSDESADSIRKYARTYHDELRQVFDSGDERIKLVGHSFIRHTSAIKDNLQLTSDNDRKKIYILLLIVVIFILCATFLAYHIDRLETERKHLSQLNNYKNLLLLSHTETIPSDKDVESDRSLLIEQLSNQARNSASSPSSQVFSISEQLRYDLTVLIEKPGNPDALIERLCKEIGEKHPKFIPSINLIFNNPKHTNRSILVLMKAGFSTADIAAILSLTPNSVHKAKQRLRSKVFGNECTTIIFDRIISLL